MVIVTNTDVCIVGNAMQTAFLVGEGYRVLRFTNLDVMADEEALDMVVLEALYASGPAHSSPPPSRGN